MHQRKGDKFTGTNDLSILPEAWKMLRISASFPALVPDGLQRYLHCNDDKLGYALFPRSEIRPVSTGPYQRTPTPHTQAPRQES